MSKRRNGAYVVSSVGTEFVANACCWVTDAGGNLNLYSTNTATSPIATFASTHWAGVKLSTTSSGSTNEETSSQ